MTVEPGILLQKYFRTRYVTHRIVLAADMENFPTQNFFEYAIIEKQLERDGF